MVQTLEGIFLDAEKVISVANELRQVDLSSIDKRLVGKVGNTKHINDLREETIRFLSIAAVGKDGYAPSQRIDDFWHEMILNTRLYAKIAERIGFFVHHVPSDVPEHEAYQRTLKAYHSVFGEPNPNCWKINDAADCASFCSDGACEASCR